jgi:hypothetical protein
MRKLFHALSSARFFVQSSTHAQLEKRRGAIMCYRKLILVLVFAAFSFCFTGAARAQCDNPDFCSDPGIPVTVDNITGSSVQCDLKPGGASQPFNQLNIGAGFGTATGTFFQSGTAKCKHLPDKADLGVCKFELTWTGVTISACNNNSFTASGSCTDLSLFGLGGDLAVTGTVTCPDSTNPTFNLMNLGIGGLTQNQCNQVFPAIKKGNTTIVDAGIVLELTITTEGSCQGPYVAISALTERYCNDRFLGLVEGSVDCTPGGPNPTTDPGSAVTPSAVPFDFAVTQTVNTSPTFCKGGNPIDKGQAKIEIFGAANFDVANIDQSSLTCEGAPLSCDPATDLNGDDILDLPCRVNTCPTFSINIGQLPRIAPGVVSATCTGQLLNSGTQIVGVADVDVSPK